MRPDFKEQGILAQAHVTHVTRFFHHHIHTTTIDVDGACGGMARDIDEQINKAP
jgi:hypothetical protein